MYVPSIPDAKSGLRSERVLASAAAVTAAAIRSVCLSIRTPARYCKLRHDIRDAMALPLGKRMDRLIITHTHADERHGSKGQPRMNMRVMTVESKVAMRWSLGQAKTTDDTTSVFTSPAKLFLTPVLDHGFACLLAADYLDHVDCCGWSGWLG